MPVVAVLVGQVLGPLGMCVRHQPQEVVNALDVSPNRCQKSAFASPFPPSLLGSVCREAALASLLSRLVSSKGEDLLLNSSSDQVVAGFIGFMARSKPRAKLK